MIKIIAIGKNKDKALKMLESEYLKRLSAFTKCEIIEVKDEPNDHAQREKEAQIIKDKEASRALEKVKQDDYVILLDLHGTMDTSEDFAKRLDSLTSTRPNIVFVIAGSLGPGSDLIKRADLRWKLSDLTFTHLMTRVLILEQIYRAFMINNHRNYHK